MFRDRTGVGGLTGGVSKSECLTQLLESLLESTAERSVLKELLVLDTSRGIELRAETRVDIHGLVDWYMLELVVNVSD